MAMKTNKWMAVLMFCFGFSFSACTSDDGLNTPNEAGQGQLVFKLSSGAEFTEDTRAVNLDTYRNTDNYIVKVYDKDNVEKLSCKGSELEQNLPLTLTIGSYRVVASYGKEHDADRNEFYVEGTTAGTVKAGNKNEPAIVTCTPTCGRISVNFETEMADYFSDFNVQFKGTKALGTKSIAWSKNDNDPWYVALDKGGEDINFTINTTTKDEYVNSANQEQTYAYTGKFRLERNKAYKMHVNVEYHPSQGGSTSGEVGLTITIDESTNDKNETIEVPVTWI